MFLKRKRQEWTPPPGVPLPRHIGDLWSIIQEIAREEDERFSRTSVMEHYHQGAEGMWDVERWLQVYRRRLNPTLEHRFPEHHPRHRGCCLIERCWPSGLSWDAFVEATLERLPIAPQPSRDALERAVDAHLDACATKPPRPLDRAGD